MLLAILLGNILYFSVRASLPYPFVHEPFRIDPGLAFDFLVCISAYGALKWIWPDSRGK